MKRSRKGRFMPSKKFDREKKIEPRTYEHFGSSPVERSIDLHETAASKADNESPIKHKSSVQTPEPMMPTLRRSSRGKKRYSEADDEAYSPGHVNKEDLSVRPGGHGLRQRPRENEVELLMECEEEDLLPAQIEAFKRDMEEFKAAERKVKAAKEEQMRLQQQQQQQHQQQQVLRQQQAVTAAQKRVVAPTSAPQPDVIIVGESPPKQNLNIQPAQPTVSSAARLVNPVPQQVYKFVNLPGQTISNTANQWVVRPLMPVMPQQNQPRAPHPTNIQKSPYAPRHQPNQQFQSSQGNYGAKRPVPYNMEQQQQYVSPPRKKVRRPEDDVGALVPLDEYYYGKKEGDPTYIEEKGEHRFKCWYCSKMLYNNVKAMMHMQGHIDSEKQQNLDLSDLTQCKHCYKQFDTPFEMQTHIEKVHMNNANVLLCRICEKDHESRQSLTYHMRQNHNACEMPYTCQLCHFRSSMYSDVVDHFKKKHEHSDCVLCLYCLKVFHIKFVSQGWGQTQNFYHHLLRHQSKTNAKKCQLCKLTFFNAQDVKAHRKKDHMPNQKGVIGMNSKYTTPDQVMIRVPETGLQPKQLGVKSLNAPAVSKVSEHRGLRFPRGVMELYCFECKMVMATNDHYKKYIQCSMCRFATSCSFAYANHMMGFHSGQMTSLSLNIPWDRPLPHVMYCLCGFGSKYGNKIANHLVFCTKRSCYKDKPAPQPKEDKGDVEQDPRRKPGASILDVLGLVKKPNIVSTDILGDESGDRRFESPERERTPSPEPTQSDVPEELTGAQKWLTVKLKDDKTPTKSAVFGGDDDSRPFTPEPDDRSGDGEDISALVQSAFGAEEELGGETSPKSGAETKGDTEGETRSEEDKGETNCQDSELKEETKTSGETRTEEDVEGETGSVRREKQGTEESSRETEESSRKTESKGETESGVFKGETESEVSKGQTGSEVSKGETETNGEKEANEETETKEESEKIPESEQTGQDSVDHEEDHQSMEDSEKNVIDEVKDGSEEAAQDDAECDNAESTERVQEDVEGDNPARADEMDTNCATDMEVSQSSECDKDKEDEKTADSEVIRRYSTTEEPLDEGQGEESVENSGQTKMDSQVDSPEERQEDSSVDRPEDLPEKKPDSPVDRQDSSERQEDSKVDRPEDLPEERSDSPVDRQDSPAERQEDSQQRQSDLQREELSKDEIRTGDEDVSQPDEASGRLEESETLPDPDSKTLSEDRSVESARPEDSEVPEEEVSEEKQFTETSRSLVSEGYNESAESGETQKKTTDERKSDSIASSSSQIVTQETPVTVTSSDKQSSDPQPSDKYAREQSGRSRDSDRERSHDHYRDRSDDRDRSRSWERSRDSGRSDDRDRSRDYDRAHERDRDRRDHHRSDRDRHGYSGGHRDRYDDRRHQNDNRNYNRYQGSHQRDYHGGYHANQPHHQGSGYRDNYGNQRDRYGQGNRGHGNYGNRDYRGRGQGYHNKY